MKIIQYEITLQQPTIILRKRGKGNFYIASDTIPGTTIGGAIASEYLKQAMISEERNCFKLLSTNEFSCDGCPVETCMFRDIVHKEKVIFSTGIPSANGKQYPIAHLASIVRPAIEPNEFYDILLETAFMKQLIKENRFFFELFKSHKKRLKKSSIIINSDLKIQEIHQESHDHVAIERTIKSSKFEYLFSNIALSPGLKFYGIGIDKTDAFNMNETNIWIGGSRSRGYGKSIVKFEQTDIDEYVTKRAKEIKSGFNKIKNLAQRFNINRTIATITGISPLKFNDNFEKSIRDRIKGLDFEILIYFAKEMQLQRWDRTKEKPLEFQPTFQEGYSVAIAINDDDIDSISKQLAEIEMNPDLIKNSMNWIFVNHPVHYEKSTL